MFKRLISAGLVFGMACTAPPVQAQVACAARNVVTSRLEAIYDERLRLTGLESAERIVEFWASDQTGTWTILLTNADGTSCVAASGDAWAEYPLLSETNGVGG